MSVGWYCLPRSLALNIERERGEGIHTHLSSYPNSMRKERVLQLGESEYRSGRAGK
jgi:hypothetical protein